MSLAVLIALFQRHIGGQPLLAYEGRQRVPWGPWGTALALFFVFLQLRMVLLAEGPNVDPDTTSAEFIQQMWLNSAITAGIALLGMAWLHWISNASPSDLGLPNSTAQAVTDIRTGAVACCASLIPVYLLLVLLQLVLHPEQGHPLIEQLIAERTPAMMVVAVVSAVIAAPLFEEFTFRLLLQGWLERWEDARLGFEATHRPLPITESYLEYSEPDNQVLAGEAGPKAEHQSSDNPYASPNTLSSAPPVADLPTLDRPASGLLPGLPHGWLPILASGLIFGLAHYGHGADPIPLFLFGIVLGYLYQRTHRLLPSVVAHMLFNALSLAHLWLALE